MRILNSYAVKRSGYKRRFACIQTETKIPGGYEREKNMNANIEQCRNNSIISNRAPWEAFVLQAMSILVNICTRSAMAYRCRERRPEFWLRVIVQRNLWILHHLIEAKHVLSLYVRQRFLHKNAESSGNKEKWENDKDSILRELDASTFTRGLGTERRRPIYEY